METSTTVQTKTRVMVAVDERDWSSYLLTWALDHLFINAPSTVEGSEAEAGMVTLIHVTQPFQHIVYPLGPAGATYYVSASVMESVKKAQDESSAAILSRALQICKDRMVGRHNFYLMSFCVWKCKLLVLRFIIVHSC